VAYEFFFKSPPYKPVPTSLELISCGGPQSSPHLAIYQTWKFKKKKSFYNYLQLTTRSYSKNLSIWKWKIQIPMNLSHFSMKIIFIPMSKSYFSHQNLEKICQLKKFTKLLSPIIPSSLLGDGLLIKSPTFH